MSDEITIKGQTFKIGERVFYKTNKGLLIECTVLGISEHENDPGLKLKYERGNNVTPFAIPGSAIDRIEKTTPPNPNEGLNPNPTPTNNPNQTPNSNYNNPTTNTNPAKPKKKNFFNSSKSISPEHSTEKFFSEILMLIALAIHLIDVFVFDLSINGGIIGARIGMYVFLVIATIVIIGDYSNVLGSFKKYGLVAAIPAIAIPSIGHLIKLTGASKDITDLIAGLALFLPIYAFYLLKHPNLDYKLLGDTKTQKMILAFTQPSGLLRIWLVFIGIILSIALITSLAQVAQESSNVIGISDSGFESKEIINGAINIIKTPVENGINVIQGIGPSVNQSYTKLYNDTIGVEYSGEVEQNKELTGVFIKEFNEIGSYYEGQKVELVAMIQMRSFVDEINMTTSCYATNMRNKSEKIQGTTNPEELHNVFRDDYRSVKCAFEPNQLSKGTYDITFKLEFNFETWAYTTLTFMDRDYLTSLSMAKEDLVRKYNINPRTRTTYTNGPIKLGMNDNMEMPIALSTTGDSTNHVPLGITIDDKYTTGGSRGFIQKVNSFQIRAPQEFTLEENDCIIPGQGELTRSLDEDTGYYIYSFDVTKKPGKYLTVSCNAQIPPNNAKNFLTDPSGKQEVTILGAATYDYELTRKTNINVIKFG